VNARQLLAPLAILVLASNAGAQTLPAPTVAPEAAAKAPRPLPGPMFESPAFTRAVDAGFRTRTGRPGPRNFVQRARYSIRARLIPEQHRLTGEESVVYTNQAPDTLDRLAVHLRQNAFAPGSPRLGPAPVTAGMELSRVALDGAALEPIDPRGEPRPGYAVLGTVMWIRPPAPIAPGDSMRLDFEWSYEPPPKPADGREGREGDVYFMGYWYPQMAVYDDVEGWVADPYLLQSEFYMDPADYDLTLTAPRGWVVDATGALMNPADVLSESTRSLLARVRQTGEVARVLTPGEGGGVFADGSGDVATWHFVANDVRDVAWGASDEWAWDATRALVPRAGGAAPDTVDIHSFFRLHEPAAAWSAGGARYTRDAIEQLSAYLWPYPWTKMSSFEGILTGGGMEYPMLTVMQPWADTLALAGDLMHETGHMWFPMMVGSNETRFVWMDEGLTQFDVAQAMRVLYGEPREGGRPNDSEPGQRMLYLESARRGLEAPLMRPGDEFPERLYSLNYNKTAQVLAALRSIVGEEAFHEALREYGRRWRGRHPYPYDFFNTFADVTGRDLGWFWRTWFEETWPLDQAIADVRADGDSLSIVVEDRGLAPMPVRIAVTRDDGTVERIEIPVDTWLTGARRTTVPVARTPEVIRVEIDPEAAFPDIDRSNQVWTAR
jgi:hypothetical protein